MLYACGLCNGLYRLSINLGLEAPIRPSSKHVREGVSR